MDPAPARDLDVDCVAQLLRTVDNVTLARCALVCVEWWKVARETPGYTRATLTGHTAPGVSVAWSTDGTLASGSCDNTIKLWKGETNTATLTGHTSTVNSVAWSTDGTLASGSYDNTIKLWKGETNTATLTGHTDFVMSVAWSPDGKTLASGSYDNTIKLWA